MIALTDSSDISNTDNSKYGEIKHIYFIRGMWHSKLAFVLKSSLNLIFKNNCKWASALRNMSEMYSSFLKEELKPLEIICKTNIKTWKGERRSQTSYCLGAQGKVW